MTTEFDAIVVGSGISGGYAAKELCEKGLKTLVIERGPEVVHGEYKTEDQAPWELEHRGKIPKDEMDKHYKIQGRNVFGHQKHYWVKDDENPYSQDKDKPFEWYRGYQTGGRSILWGKQCYRWSDLDFEANKKDGHGNDWPIRYKDIAPWYDKVEAFVGISGQAEGLPQLPDGIFQKPMDLRCPEKHLRDSMKQTFKGRVLTIGRCAHLTDPTAEQLELGRGQCQFRNECQRGCSFGAYFSSLSATLPAARRTGNLTIVNDAIAHSVEYDPRSGRATGVRIIDRNTKEGRVYRAKVIFMCASAVGSTQVLLNSRSEAHPTGLGNKSAVLGKYLMDHIFQSGAVADIDGFEDSYYAGRRPNGFYIPRFQNVWDEETDFVRGYGYQGGAHRANWDRGGSKEGFGPGLKAAMRRPGPWFIGMSGFGEMLPYEHNHMRLDFNTRDQWGMPLVHTSCEHGRNEKNMLAHMAKAAVEMFSAAGFKNVRPFNQAAPPGRCIHEMGTARMGRDPGTSYLNAYNQSHEVPNLFVTDGAAFASSACQNPSITYMALTARAVDYAVRQMQEGTL